MGQQNDTKDSAGHWNSSRAASMRIAANIAKLLELVREPSSALGTPWGSQGKCDARLQVQHWPGTACRYWVL
jgi:hypothetical protein